MRKDALRPFIIWQARYSVQRGHKTLGEFVGTLSSRQAALAISNFGYDRDPTILRLWRSPAQPGKCAPQSQGPDQEVGKKIRRTDYWVCSGAPSQFTEFGSMGVLMIADGNPKEIRLDACVTVSRGPFR